VAVKIYDVEDNLDVTRLEKVTETDMRRINRYLKALSRLKKVLSAYQEAAQKAAEEKEKADNLAKRTHYMGCILGGAIGDALGAPIEFMSISEILRAYGPNGVTDYVEYPDGTGEITDDTQMTLFTAEGLLRAYHRGKMKGIKGAQVSMCWYSYLRWLYTQQGYAPKILNQNEMLNGWLIEQKELFRNRAPGNTCLSALRSEKFHTIEEPANNSKGCGTVMRMAPAGLIYAWSMEEALENGAKISATTHGHSSGYLSGAVLAAIIYCLNEGKPLRIAITESISELKKWDEHEELLAKIEEALLIDRQHQYNSITYREIEQLGGGWVAEEALAISLLCALQHPNDFEAAVVKAINHSGDCDSTGAITGNIVGMMVGEEGIPERWKRNLRYKHIIEQTAHDLWLQFDGEMEATREWARKYPTN
jgi:ADP-ribosylglycohydrolase